MRKILVVSDTHRKDENFYKAVEMESPVDLIIHCGDTEGSETEMQQLSGAPMRIVRGNNDFFCNLPDEQVFEVWPHTFFLSHGHKSTKSMCYCNRSGNKSHPIPCAFIHIRFKEVLFF